MPKESRWDETMKTELMLVLVGVTIVNMALADTTNINEVMARWSRVNAVAVHFMPALDGQKWVNKKLSEVIPVAEVAKIILIEAVTSAPPDINIFNIYKILEGDATFYQLGGQYLAIGATYRAIIVAKDNHAFLIEIGRGPDGKRLTRLTSEEGIYGYFK